MTDRYKWSYSGANIEMGCKFEWAKIHYITKVISFATKTIDLMQIIEIKKGLFIKYGVKILEPQQEITVTVL